jgi:CTP:molybdopterin cytidylyltransferase MocA
MKIQPVVMASGTGERFGQNKLLLSLGQKPLFTYILDTLILCQKENPDVLPPIVVTRWESIALTAGEKGCSVILHTKPLVSDTIALGAKASLENKELQGTLFCVADQPLLSATTILQIIEGFTQEPTKIVRARQGNPVLFPQNLVPLLTTLPEGKTGSFLIKQYPELVMSIPFTTIEESMDIDTPQEFEQVKNYINQMLTK